MCSQTDDDPGPPLDAKVSGHFDLSVTSLRVYAMKKMLARGCSSSRFRTSVPVVAVYGMLLPPMVIVWSVLTRRSTAGGAGNCPEGAGAAGAAAASPCGGAAAAAGVPPGRCRWPCPGCAHTTAQIMSES